MTRMSRRDFAKPPRVRHLARSALARMDAGQNPAAQSSAASGCRPPVSLTPTREPWMNWALSEPEGPEVKYTPTSVSHLVGIARNANAQARVRASGSRWSSSAAARADSAWIDTSELRGVISSNLNQLANERSPKSRLAISCSFRPG